MRTGFPGASGGYRPDIDGLRAVAVTAVLLFHALPSFLPGGFVGVDIFFVISGYLISGILFDGHEQGTFTFRDFYARRIRRIFPSLLLVLGTVLLIGWFVLLAGPFTVVGRHTAASAAFIENFARWRESGYFDSDAEPRVLLHLWSLAIEEQFYVWWPLILFAAYRLKVRVGILLAVAGAASFAWCVRQSGADPVGAFFSPVTRGWELLLGAAWAFWHRDVRVPPVASNLLSLAGLALIAVALTQLSPASTFPGMTALLPTLGAVLIIAAGPSALPNRLLLSNRLMVGIGLISYPLYLWHWPLLAFQQIILGDEASAAARLAVLGFSVVLAILSYRWVELPLRRRPLKAWRATVLTGAMIALGIAGFVVAKLDGIPGRSSIARYENQEAWFATVEDWPYAENADCLKRYPSADRRERWWFCVMNRDAPPTVFLMGNSFSNHLYPGFAVNADLGGHTILQYGTCDPAMGIQFSAYVKGSPCFGDKRRRQEEFTSRIVESSPSLKFVILSAAWPRFGDTGDALSHTDGSKVEGEYRSLAADPDETSYDAFMAGLERRIAFLVGRGVRPILFYGTPELSYSPRSCYSAQPFRPGVNSCVLSRESEMKKQQRFRAGVEAIQSRHPALLVFDPLTALCGTTNCDLKGPAGPLLRDRGHLSIAGSRVVGEAFVEWAGIHVPEILKRP